MKMKPQPSQLSATPLRSFVNSHHKKRLLHDQRHAGVMTSLSNSEQSKATKSPRIFTFGQKLRDTVKGKLSLGAKIVQAGGVGNVFKSDFALEEGEELVKTLQCCLWTTAGPIGGLLFISTEKVCFYSERSFKLRPRVVVSSSSSSSPGGELPQQQPVTQVRYKVTIPLSKIKCANERRNVKKPTKKRYVQVMTEDEFEFWFMGFMHHSRTLRFLQEAILSSHQNQCQCHHLIMPQSPTQ